MEKLTIKDVYDSLATERNEYLERFKKYDQMTIKNLIVNDDYNKELPSGYASEMGDLVESQRNRFLTENFPVNDSFVKLTIGKKGKRLLEKEGIDPIMAENQVIELQEVIQEIFNDKGYRAAVESSIDHLIVAGDVLLQKLSDKDGGDLIYYSLENYVKQYDNRGNVVLLIIKEMVSKEEAVDIYKVEIDESIVDEDGMVEVYHKYERVNSKTKTYTHEIAIDTNDLAKDGKNISWDKFKLYPLTWRRNNGENYGRGNVELNYAAIKKFNLLSKWETMAMVELLKVKHGVETTNPEFVKKLNEAGFGKYVQIDGKVTTIADGAWAQILQQIKILKDDTLNFLQKRFGQTSTSELDNRDRVTAREIEMRDRNSRISTHSTTNIAKNFTRPFAEDLLNEAISDIELDVNEELFRKVKSIKITTGIDLIGRNEDLQKFQTWAQSYALLNNLPQSAQEDINFAKTGIALGNMIEFDAKQITKTAQEKTAEAEAANSREIDMQNQINAAKAAQQNTQTN